MQEVAISAQVKYAHAELLRASSQGIAPHPYRTCIVKTDDKLLRCARHFIATFEQGRFSYCMCSLLRPHRALPGAFTELVDTMYPGSNLISALSADAESSENLLPGGGGCMTGHAGASY